MAKKYLSLTEASEMLQVDPEELKNMRAQGEIRGFADRGTWKFRSEDVDNLIRSRQVDSDPEVPILADDDFGAGLAEPSASDVTLSASTEMDALESVLGDDDDPGDSPTSIRGKDEDLSRSDSDVRLIVDDSISLADSDPELSIVDGSDSDVALAPGSDSDVRLTTESGILAGSGLLVGSVGEIDSLDLDENSDSDVQLVAQDSDSDVQLTKDDSDSDVQLVDGTSGEVDINPAMLQSDSDVRLSGAEIEVTPDSDSDVQLVDVAKESAGDIDLATEADVEMVDGGASDSDVVLPVSDAEVVVEDASSDDVSLSVPEDEDSGISLDFDDDEDDDSASVLLGPEDSGITLEGSSGLLLAGDSGISLEGPMDSGISLDMDDEGISLADDSSGIALEAVGDSGISLEADSGIALADATESGVDLDGTAAEFETFDMEDMDDVPETQFEIPAEGDDSEFDLDVGDETGEFEIEDDATAEFDLSDSMDDTGEFDLDDSDMSDVSDFDSLDAASVADIDLLEGDDAFDDDAFDSEAGGASYGAVAAMARPSAAQQEWGAMPVVLSVVSMLCMLVGAVMSFDLLSNIYSWNSAEPITGVLIDSLSGLFG